MASQERQGRWRTVSALLLSTLSFFAVLLPPMYLAVWAERTNADLFGLATSTAAREVLFYASLSMAVFVALLVLSFRLDTRDESLVFGQWRVKARYFLWAVGCALGIRAIQFVLSRSNAADTSGPVAVFLREAGNDAAGYVIALLFFAAVVPVLEEIVFRRVLYGLLERLNSWIAIVGSSLLFAAIHPKGLMGSAFLLGLATALLYRRSRSLLPSICCHSTFNLTGVFLTIISLS